MRRDDLDEAMELARRFLKAAEKAQELNTSDMASGCAATAATKRASMDLTRSLARLRNPWRRED